MSRMLTLLRRLNSRWNMMTPSMGERKLDTFWIVLKVHTMIFKCYLTKTILKRHFVFCFKRTFGLQVVTTAQHVNMLIGQENSLQRSENFKIARNIRKYAKK